MPDATWVSPEYDQELETKEPLVLERAPEICVEVLSPSDFKPEMEEKRALYFEAGAHEVWICGRDGKMEFYTPDWRKLRGFALHFPANYDSTISFISVRLLIWWRFFSFIAAFNSFTLTSERSPLRLSSAISRSCGVCIANSRTMFSLLYALNSESWCIRASTLRQTKE